MFEINLYTEFLEHFFPKNPHSVGHIQFSEPHKWANDKKERIKLVKVVNCVSFCEMNGDWLKQGEFP